MHELRATSRPSSLEKNVRDIESALEAYARDDLASAVLLLERVKNAAHRSGRVRELLGLSLYQLGRWQDAARELLTYKRLTASVDQNHVIADCYRALGRPDRAIEVCAEVAAGDVGPETWSEVTIVAASAYADKGDIPRALAQLPRADVEPRSVEPFHLRLWYVKADLLERAGRAQEAKVMWERIAAEDPDFYDVSERLTQR